MTADGRTVVVAGGTGGLGAAVTAEFLRAGWRVVVPGRTEAGLEKLGANPVVAAAGEAFQPILADLTNPGGTPDPVGSGGVEGLVEPGAVEVGGAAEVAALAAADEAAPVRALVNLVGGFGSGGRVHETSVEDFEYQLRLNLRPTYLITQAVLPQLVAAGGGSIVCTSSAAALRPFSGAAGYITAKAAVLAFADALTAEYKRAGIRVNTILPGVIDTPQNRAAQPGADPSGWTPPARIAEVVRFLAETDGVAGARIPV